MSETHVSDIHYGYRRREVLHGLSLRFAPGAHLLLGANGAGKSTLLEIMASVRRPWHGSVAVGGITFPCRGAQALADYRSDSAWLPQSFRAFPRLTVRDHVAYSGWLKGMSRSAAWQRAGDVIREVGLGDLEHRRVTTLSGGQQQRVGIAGALVHDAKLVLLDEPTAGLDPAQQERFRRIVFSIAADRVVVTSSHDPGDMDESLASVAVLHNGELAFHGTPEAFMSPARRAGSERDRFTQAYRHWTGDDET